MTSGNAAVAGPRIDLLIARAATAFVLVDQPGAKECDLVAKAVVDGEARGYLLERRERRRSRAIAPPSRR